MKNKVTLASIAALLLLMTVPAQADVIADQSRISVSSHRWAGLETVALPFLGIRTQQ